MDEKKQQAVVDDVRLHLRQIALELQAAAEGATRAADAVPNRKAAWPAVQQMYTRLDEANHLADRFKAAVTEALANAAPAHR